MSRPTLWPSLALGRRTRRGTPVESATTELVRLPGLDVAVNTERPEAKPGHWIERGPLKRLMVFSGRSHPELAQRIAEQLGVELGEVELKTFSNGETYCRYHESIRGADVFLVQTGCAPVDRNLMELLFMIQAAKLASAKRITAVIPWFPYSRQDRKALPREPISGRLVADMIQLAGADRVLTMDLHAGQIQGFFTIPVDHMTSLPLFARHFRDLGLSGDAVVSVAPDAGRAKHAIRFAEMIEGDFAVMHKTRPEHDKASVTEITGRVKDKVAIVGDDVIMTGGTLLAGAEALREHGATAVWVFTTHGLFSDGALERFAGADLAGIVVTDTVPIDPVSRPSNLTVLPISGLLAETIMNVFADESVSAIFGGEYQLF
jgi:ribose-phosphate pyrophosphokinase